MGINNAHILYNQNHIGPKLTLLQFSLEVIRGLLIPIRQEEGPRVVVVDHQPTKGTVGDNGRIRRDDVWPVLEMAWEGTQFTYVERALKTQLFVLESASDCITIEIELQNCFHN